jgi:hypothetical protein
MGFVESSTPLPPEIAEMTKGHAPVDPVCQIASIALPRPLLILASSHVYIDSSGVIYDATLNQTDIAKNVRSQTGQSH